jgi:hypothetical protein
VNCACKERGEETLGFEPCGFHAGWMRRARQEGRDEVLRQWNVSLANKPQRQDSVTAQLIELHNLAVRGGLYDADDVLVRTINLRLARGADRKGG